MVTSFINITVTGLEEMLQRLNEMTGAGADQAVQSSLEQVSTFMATEMRNNAHVITGNMRDSIQSSVSGNEAIVECTAEYAVYENARVGGIQGPHDFADRAVQATQNEGPRIVKEEFDRIFNL